MKGKTKNRKIFQYEPVFLLFSVSLYEGKNKKGILISQNEARPGSYATSRQKKKVRRKNE